MSVGTNNIKRVTCTCLTREGKGREKRTRSKHKATNLASLLYSIFSQYSAILYSTMPTIGKIHVHEQGIPVYTMYVCISSTTTICFNQQLVSKYSMIHPTGASLCTKREIQCHAQLVVYTINLPK